MYHVFLFLVELGGLGSSSITEGVKIATCLQLDIKANFSHQRAAMRNLALSYIIAGSPLCNLFPYKLPLLPRGRLYRTSAFLPTKLDQSLLLRRFQQASLVQYLHFFFLSTKNLTERASFTRACCVTGLRILFSLPKCL